jgi:hypothetical protein
MKVFGSEFGASRLRTLPPRTDSHLSPEAAFVTSDLCPVTEKHEGTAIGACSLVDVGAVTVTLVDEGISEDRERQACLPSSSQRSSNLSTYLTLHDVGPSAELAGRVTCTEHVSSARRFGWLL